MKIISFSLVLALFCAGLVFGETIKNYSADEVEAGSGTVVGKFHATENKCCLEVYEGRNPEILLIINLDQMMIDVCQISEKTYSEFPIEGNDVYDCLSKIAQSFGIQPEISRERQGTEIVNGYLADKYRTTIKVNMFGDITTITTYEWMAPEFDFPVRFQNEGLVLEMKNINTSMPSASLFELPIGYRNDSSMEGLMRILPF